MVYSGSSCKMKSKNGEAKTLKDVPTNNHRIWHSVSQVYRDFANESSVHGIKYTIQAKTTIERLLWLIVVIISLVCSGELANKFYERHTSANMRTTVVTNQFPSLKLALPAVTLCQGHLVSAERLRPYLNMQKRLYIPRGLSIDDFEHGLRYLREMIYPLNYFSSELEKLQRILDANRMSLPQLLEQLSPNCTNLLITCVYDGQNEACDKLFVPTLTSHGICCSFNNAAQNKWQLSTKYTNSSNTRDLYSIKFGSRYILSVLLKPYNSSDRLASITYGDGYKVLIHERYTLPGPNSLEFMAGEGHETVIGLHGTYLSSSPEILNLPPRQRDCRKSGNGKIYRSENCYMKCRNTAIYEICNCIPFFSTDLDRGNSLCNLTNLPCLARILSDIYSMTLRDPQCDHCLPDCESTKYTVSITGEPFDAAQFKPGKFFEKAREYPNSTALHITFAGQAAVLERRELVLSWINLVSSLGGVFSLFLGCSFISVIEFFYFFFFQLVRRLKLKYKKNSPVINLR